MLNKIDKEQRITAKTKQNFNVQLSKGSTATKTQAQRQKQYRKRGSDTDKNLQNNNKGGSEKFGEKKQLI